MYRNCCWHWAKIFDGFWVVLCSIFLNYPFVQEPFVNMPIDTIMDALRLLLGNEIKQLWSLSYLVHQTLSFSDYNYPLLFDFVDVRNHPVLIHCKQGKVFALTLLAHLQLVFITLYFLGCTSNSRQFQLFRLIGGVILLLGIYTIIEVENHNMLNIFLYSLP